MAQRREATVGVHRLHSISRLAVVTLLAACISAPPGVPKPEKVVPVIPAPHVARPGGTESWVAPDTLNVWIADTASAELKALGVLAANIVSVAVGRNVPLETGPSDRHGSVQLRLIQPLVAEKEGAYTLTVAPEGIEISSSSGAGLFYGLQTLRQLFDAAAVPVNGTVRSTRMPSLTIVDTPRFPWRGLHLDVG